MILKSFPSMLGLVLAGALLTACGENNNDGNVDTAADRTATSTENEVEGAVNETQADLQQGANDAANAANSAVNDAQNEVANATSDPWTRTYETPAAERAGTVENLNGLRATLVAELDQVRARLKDGARSADEKKADSQRAGELAQGLERLDRTIKEISESNDVTWAQVRESNIKAANDFRTWMSQYGMAS